MAKEISDAELIAMAKSKGITVPSRAEPSDDELIAMAKAKGIDVNGLSKTKPDLFETATDKLTQGMAFGHLPQLSGLTDAAVMSLIGSGVDKDLESKGFKIKQPGFEENYISSRDAKQKRLNEESAARPITSGLLEATGAVGSGLLTAGLLPSSAGVGGAIAAGAIGAGAYAPETIEKEKPFDNISGNIAARGKQAALGAATAGLIKGAGSLKGQIFPSKAATALEGELSGGGVGTGKTSYITTSTNNPDFDALNQVQKIHLPVSSVDELKKRVASAPKELLDRPTAKIVIEAESKLPYKPSLPLSGVDKAILSDAAQERTIKALQERPETAKLFSQQAQIRKNEAANAIDDFASKVGGSKGVKSSKLAAGQDFIDSLSSGYEAVKQKLGPKFEAMHEVPVNPKQIVEDVKLIADSIAPNATVFEQSVINDAMKKLSDPNISLRKIQDIRELLRNSIDPTKPNQFRATRDLRSMLLNMMEANIEDSAKAVGASPLGVRDTFKGWAKNEQLRDTVENLIGSDLRNTMASSPDKVFDSVFKNVATVRQLNTMVGKEKMRELAGSLISSIKSGATKDTGELMSAKMSNLIKSKRNELSQILSKTEMDQLTALSTYYQGIEKLSQTMNPSGTAAAIEASMSRNARQWTTNPVGSLLDLTLGGAERAVKGQAAKSEINSLLGAGKELNPKITKNAPGVINSLLRPSYQHKEK